MALRKLAEETEDQVILAYKAGGSLENLGVTFGCSTGTIRNLLVRRGVERRGSGRIPSPRGAKKTCSSCGKRRLRQKFYGDGQRGSQCRKCLSGKSREKYDADPELRRKKRATATAYRLANPEATRARIREWATGWTPEQFAVAWEAQKGLCAICSKPMQCKGLTPDSVCADHNHATGQRRALLCRQCNLHLGIYEKNQRRFAAYLKAFEEGFCGA